jgi:hypothetical protein
MSSSKALPKFQTRKRNQYPCEVAVWCRTSASVARDCALALCQRYKVPSTSITVFIESKDDLPTYMKVLLPGSYHRLVAIGASGFDFINSIHDFYPIGCHLVVLEDSVYDILDVKLGFMKSFVSLLKRGFAECETSGAHLWGLYPGLVYEGMRTTVSYGLKLLHSGLWGCINPGRAVISLHVEGQEMAERCILHWTTFHAVVRLNGYGVKQKTQKRASDTSCIELKSLYPGYILLKESNGGHLSVRLRETKDRVIEST